jgi:hypothetical protein
MTDARHPLTWWIWSITLAIGIARGNNPLLAIAVVGCAYLVVRIFRTDAPWSRSFESGLKLGLWILIIRTTFGVLIGTPIPGTTLFRLPMLPLPEWMAGIRIGGAQRKRGCTASSSSHSKRSNSWMKSARQSRSGAANDRWLAGAKGR